MILLYIDPGTGSALFSILIGLVTTLYFVGNRLWIRLKMAFSSRGKVEVLGRRERIAIYSEGKRYWNVFLPVVEELERRGVAASYLTSEEDDPAFERGSALVKPRYIGKGNLAYARLNMLEADLCLMTTPGLEVYQLKRSKGVRHYSHVLHAVDDATSYRLFGLDYFDSILLTGEYQAAAIRELEAKRHLPPKELRVVGSTYLDVYRAKLGDLPRRDGEGLTVLVSPSWGASGLLRRYGERLLLPLAQSGLRVIVRPHPQSASSEADTLERLRGLLSPYPNVEWDFGRENLASLSRADLMISDFSGIVFDYAFLFGRPLLYALQDFDPRPYDASDVEGPLWKFDTIRRIGKELKPEDFKRIGELARSLAGDRSLGEAIGAARDEAWQFRGESGKRIADFMLERTSEPKGARP